MTKRKPERKILKTTDDCFLPWKLGPAYTIQHSCFQVCVPSNSQSLQVFTLAAEAIPYRIWNTLGSGNISFQTLLKNEYDSTLTGGFCAFISQHFWSRTSTTRL